MQQKNETIKELDVLRSLLPSIRISPMMIDRLIEESGAPESDPVARSAINDICVMTTLSRIIRNDETFEHVVKDYSINLPVTVAQPVIEFMAGSGFLLEERREDRERLIMSRVTGC